MNQRRPALLVDELWEGEMTGTVVEGIALVVLNVAGSIHAYVDRCAHVGFPLSKGTLAGAVLTCSAHGWQFDARTGEGINPRKARLEKVPAEALGGVILVDVSAVRPRGASCVTH